MASESDGKMLFLEPGALCTWVDAVIKSSSDTW